MRTLNIVFEDKEYKQLESEKDKEKKNWHDFILGLINKGN